MKDVVKEQEIMQGENCFFRQTHMIVFATLLSELLKQTE